MYLQWKLARTACFFFTFSLHTEYVKREKVLFFTFCLFYLHYWITNLNRYKKIVGERNSTFWFLSCWYDKFYFARTIFFTMLARWFSLCWHVNFYWHIVHFDTRGRNGRFAPARVASFIEPYFSLQMHATHELAHRLQTSKMRRNSTSLNSCQHNDIT